MVGARESGKMLRLYEKGRAEGDQMITGNVLKLNLSQLTVFYRSICCWLQVSIL